MVDNLQHEDDLNERKYRPVTPKLFTGMMWVWSPVLSGIGLALNWRGLGRPLWILPTLLLSLVFPLVTFGLPLYLIRRFPEISTLGGCLLPTILGINYGYVAGLAEFQRDAYRKWYAGNEQAMLKHLYSLDPALWKAGKWIVGFHVVIWGVVIILTAIQFIVQIASQAR
jgi:hypothetical protein